MVRKIREFGQGDPEQCTHCERCGRYIDVDSTLGGILLPFSRSGKLIQCPECGRFVCIEKCWDAEKGVCKICSAEIPDQSELKELRDMVERLQAEVEKARKLYEQRIKALEAQLKQWEAEGYDVSELKRKWFS